MSKKVKVLVVPVGKVPEVREIENTLEALQEIVGGYIENVTLEPRVYLICNEEGIQEDLPLNRDLENIGLGPILGDFLIVRVDSRGDNISLTDADIAKYTLQFSILA